jgi:hypothetical protein
LISSCPHYLQTPVLLFIIEHGRRRILHFNITSHPTSDWVVQQLREAFPTLVRIVM